MRKMIAASTVASAVISGAAQAATYGLTFQSEEFVKPSSYFGGTIENASPCTIFCEPVSATLAIDLDKATDVNFSYSIDFFTNRVEQSGGVLISGMIGSIDIIRGFSMGIGADVFLRTDTAGKIVSVGASSSPDSPDYALLESTAILGGPALEGVYQAPGFWIFTDPSGAVIDTTQPDETISPVPLPAALPLLVFGLGGMLVVGRRKRRRP